jgi:hypothetical protein
MARDHKVNYDITATDSTGRALASVKQNLSGVNSAVLGMKGMLAGLTPILAGVGFARLGKDAIDAADQINKMSQKVGVSVESLSTLKYAAELSDVSLESLGTGLKKLSVNMLDTQTGTGEAKDAFKALGISVTDTRGNLKGTEDVLLELAERFSGMEDGAGKTALAVKLFGRAGAELIPFLNQGRSGIAALTAEAEKLGIKMSGETAKAAETFNDNLTSLRTAVDGTARAMVNPLLPALIDITNQMKEGAKEGGIFKGILEGLRASFANLVGLTARGDLERANKDIAHLTDRLEKAQALRDAGGRSMGMGSVESLSARLAQAYGAQQNALDRLSLERPDAFDMTGGAPVKKGAAPRLPGTDKDAAKRLRDAEFVARQQAEAEEEFAKQSAEAWRFWADHETKEREKDRATEGERMRAWFDMIDREQDEAIESGRLLVQNSLSETAKSIESNTSAARELGLTFSSAFEDAVIEGKKLRDVLKGLAQDVLRIFVRKQVTEPLANMASSAFGSIDWGSIFSFKADGGPVSGGRPYIVGEQGPELFVPGMSGGIVPNHALAGGGVTINQTIQFSANTPAAVRDAVFAMMPTIQRSTLAAVRDERNRTADIR